VTLSAARRLARFVVDLELKDVPAPTVEKAGLLVLDTLGCCLAAARYDFGRAARATAERLGGPPESALVGSRVRVAAANAALANATLAHGLDFDDTREDAIVHTGSVAVTTSLAVGEATGASGRATRTSRDGLEILGVQAGRKARRAPFRDGWGAPASWRCRTRRAAVRLAVAHSRRSTAG